MTSGKMPHAPSLKTLLCRRILLVAALAVAVQIVIILRENLGNERYFTTHYVKQEAAKIARHISDVEGTLVFDYKGLPPYYSNQFTNDYAFRVIVKDIGLIGMVNPEILKDVSPAPFDAHSFPDVWLQKLKGKGWFHVAGGDHYKIAGQDVWIEVATLGDPAKIQYQVLLKELLVDVWIPMLPLILLIVVFTAYFLNRSLQPLTQAARQAEQIKADDCGTRFDLNELPLEAASFAAAINRLLDRVSKLVASQKRLVSSTAHELRTPLAIMLLELENMADPRAVHLQSDVEGMADTINRLLTLARLDSEDKLKKNDVDLAEIAQDVVEGLKRLAQSRDNKIMLDINSPEDIIGDAESIYAAVRNLVENAIKHTGTGKVIHLTCGPGPSVTVEDNGPGLPEGDTRELFKPFKKGVISSDGAGLGLAIVKHVVELHKGAIEVGCSSKGGARFKLFFG